MLPSMYESGNNRGGFGTYSAGDVFRIAVENNVVKYYRNGNFFYISGVSPTLPLLVDVSINNVNGTVTNAVVSNYNTGTLTATATNAGTNPTYQWKLNGANVGANSGNYSNTGMADNDAITCVLTPDLGGCYSTTYTSNIITNRIISNSVNVPVFGLGASSNRCQGAGSILYSATVTGQNVGFTDLVGVISSGHNLIKTAATAWGNGGAASTNKINDNSYAYTIVSETNTSRYFGLSNTNANANNTTIQYAFYLINTGSLEVRESGTARATGLTYATGDTLKIAVVSGTVKYYKNSTLVYTSGVAPVLPLIVDVSLYTLYSTLNSIHTNAIFNYSLDAASLAAGNTINATTGNVTYSAGWSGATTITASATGCNGTLTSTHIATTNTAPSIISQSGDTSVFEGANFSFVINATGTNLIYKWQENQGSGWYDLTNGGVFSNVTTAAIRLTGVTVGMNGYQYRCLITGTCSPDKTSNTIVLSVQPLTIYFARASGPWDALTTWSTVSGDGPAASTIPTVGGVVNIGNGSAADDRIVTVPLNSDVMCTTLTIGGNDHSNGLVFSGGTSTLTVVGDVTINTPTQDKTNTLNIGDGEATIAGNFTLNGNSTSASRITSLMIANGSVNISGNLAPGDGSYANTARVDLSAGAGTINLEGDFTLGTAGEFVPGALSNFNFNGSAAQSITGSTDIIFNNLAISNPAGVNLNAGFITTTDNLTINAGSILTIPPLGNLKVISNLSNLAGNPGLVIQADATGTGSLIHSTAGVNATVQQYFTDNSATYYYHTNSSPVTSALASVYLIPGAGPYLYYYNPASSASKWINIKDVSTPLNPGTGYLINYKTRTTAETISYTGQLNTGNIDIPLVPDGDGNNLIGNPYPCAINWDSPVGWTFGNTDNYITIWNPSDGSYGSYVRGVGIGTHGVTNVIPSGQGFFVRAIGNTTLSMANEVKMHDNSLIKSSATTPAYIKIRVTNDTNSFNDELVVYYNVAATKYFDSGLEAKKVFSIMKESSQIYTWSDEGVSLAINALPEDNNDSIVIFFKCGIPARYTMKIVESNGIDSVVLSDLFTTNSLDFLTNEYRFSGSPSDTTLRFVINMKKGVEEGNNVVSVNNSNEIAIWTSLNGLHLKNMNTHPMPGCLTVTDVLGRIVYKDKFTLITEESREGFEPGFYIVSFVSENHATVKKVLIR
ncbi:MAG: T9SS type A sorting domain-containing protein [Bacteroidales bacterium]